MPKPKMLPAGGPSSETDVVPDREAKLATEDGRFKLYLKCGSFAEVARRAGVTPTAIKKMAERGSWLERRAAHDRKLGLSRAASASQKTLGHLEKIDAAIDQETSTWADADEATDVMHRAAGAIQVVERLHKVQREALADLPPEAPVELDHSPLSDAQLALWRLGEEISAAMRAKPGKPIVLDLGAGAAFTALLESEVGKEFLRGYASKHGLNGLLGLV